MRICFDLDGTICHTKLNEPSYSDVLPIDGMPELIRQYKKSGATIIINTARHMKTCGNNVGQVVARQGKILFDWLEKHNIPYDEIYFGKPLADFYIDDKAIKFVDTEQLKNTLPL